MGEAGQQRTARREHRVVFQAARILSEAGVDALSGLEAIRHGSGDSSALDTIAELGGSQRFAELAGPYLEKDVVTVKRVAEKHNVDLGVLGDVADQMGVST